MQQQHSYLRKVQVWQESMAHNSRERVPSSMGPAILVSGFLTKKTRRMNRWKRRWWQLLDNGMLLYFKDDERVKLLGEIDVGRTCYDVRLGAERCKVSFPRVVPSCCCVAFSVLKRTYYIYAPTAAETKRWAENLYNVSLVLNRRRSASRSVAPGPPRPPSCPPSLHLARRRVTADSIDDVNRLAELQDKATELPVFQRGSTRSRPLLTHHKLHSSVPGYLDQIGSPDSLSQDSNPRLWLDGSPSPSLISTFKPALKTHPPHIERQQVTSPLGQTQQTQQSLSSSYSQDLDSIHQLNIPENLGGGTVPRMGEKRKRASLPSTFMRDFAKLEHKEAQIRKKLEQFDAPTRPASVTDYTQVRGSYLPQGRPRQQSLGGVPVLPSLMKHYSSTSVLSNPKTPPPVKPKPIIKTPKGVAKREPSFVMATRIIAVTSPTGLENSTSVTTTNVATINKDIEDVQFPPRPRINSGPPNFIPPPPPDGSPSPTPCVFPEVTSPSWAVQRSRTASVIQGASSCSEDELQKLVAEIKRCGQQTRNERTEVVLHKLMTSRNMFENLMGTLFAAKQRKIIGYEGELLCEGRDNNTFITLLRDNQ